MTQVYDLATPGGPVVESRTISAPGATAGHVLTVAPDGTVSPAPGGGAVPVITKTITAAELSDASWDSGGGVLFAAIEIPEIAVGVPVLWIVEFAQPTIDGDFVEQSLNAYSPSASSEDIFNSGEGFSITYSPWSDATVGTYGYNAPNATATGAVYLLPGAAFYINYGGSVAPTTGDIALVIGVLPALP